MALDPVCGREISPKQSQWLLSYNGQIYHFCSGKCRHDFDDAPEDYSETCAKAPASDNLEIPRHQDAPFAELRR